MKKNIIAVFDSLGSIVVGLDYTTLEPEQYIAEENRRNLQNPHPLCKTAKFFLLGSMDDENMIAELLPAARPIGDLQWSVKKLEAYAESNKKEKVINDGN